MSNFRSVVIAAIFNLIMLPDVKACCFNGLLRCCTYCVARTEFFDVNNLYKAILAKTATISSTFLSCSFPVDGGFEVSTSHILRQ